MKKETAQVLGLGALLVDFIQRQRDAPIYVVNSLPGNHSAMTIPPIGIFILSSQLQNKNLIEHEQVHWKQFQRYGTAGFYLRYLIGSFGGYDHNPMEIEARFNESEYCKQNYTQCVRDGSALTVHNPKFRS